MKRDRMTLALDLGSELIIDNFAGGGGTSTGLEAAFGRPVDIAINHDPEALALLLPRVRLTKSAQVRMCGNSVCPPLSEALIRANFQHEQQLSLAAA